MTQPILGILGMAGLFVLFGVLRLADRRSCDGGCTGCTHDCDAHIGGGIS